MTQIPRRVDCRERRNRALLSETKQTEESKKVREQTPWSRDTLRLDEVEGFSQGT